MHTRARHAILLAVAVLVTGLLVAPGGATAQNQGRGKIANDLRVVVDQNLGDALYADEVPDHVAGTVYYLAKLQSVNAASLAAVRAAGATVRHRFDLIGWVALSSSRSAVNRVAGLPQVSKLVADRVLHLAQATSTPLPAGPDGFANQTLRGTHDVGADAEWAHGVTGKDITVGVIDSGIDENHSDLTGKVDSFVNCMTVVPTLVSSDVGSCAPSPGVDDNGHGTHVSGIIAGDSAGKKDDKGNKVLPGMAPDAHLVGAKVCNAAGSCLNSSVMAGMIALASSKADGGAGAQIINLSLGGGPFYSAFVSGAQQVTDADPEAQLINALADKYNVVWAIAAGNAGPTLQSVGSPSTASQGISVGASVTDWDLRHPTAETLHGMHGDVIKDAPAGTHGIANFSSRGPSGDRLIKPDITAPGAYVVSLEASTGGEVHAGDAAVNNNYSSDPNYAVLSGTSMAAPSAAGAAALIVDGYHQSTGNLPAYYVVKAAMANTAHANTFEGPITGLISSIKANDLGMDLETLFPSRNDGEVGVTGVGAGRVSVPDAILASTAGVVAYTPRVRNADGLLTTDAWQPSWSLDDVAPGETNTQHFILRGGPKLPQDANVTFSVESGPEALGVNAAPASWFSLPASATAVPGSPAGGFDVTLSVPGGNIAPGQYTANILANADLGNGVFEHLRIPVQFFVPMTTGAELSGPIWASDVTDYSIVGLENPLGQIYSDWSMVPLRIPTSSAGTSLTFKVWDDAGASTMDVFVFDSHGIEVDSTVDEPLHAVPNGAALQPTSKDSPGSVSIDVVAPGATLSTAQVHAGDVVWLVLSDTKPANPAKFETYHLSVS